MPGHGPRMGRSPAAVPRFAPRYVLSQTYRQAVLAAGPALYWPLDATYGATDQTGNGRNGSAGGGVSFGGFPASPTAVETTSTDLDGSDDRVSSTYGPYLNGTARTFMGWAWLDTSAAGHALFGVVTHTGTEPSCRVDAGAAQVVFLPANGTPVVWATSWPGTLRWVHWALVFDEAADTAELYIDGASQGTRTASDAYNASPGNLALGVTGDTFDAWDGKMAHFAVFERQLSAAEILQIYRAGGGSNDTLTLSGAVASGVAPIVQVAVLQGGGLGSGTAPTVVVPVPQGGGLGSGTGPVARGAVPQGGGVGSGVAATVLVPVSPGGAVGGATAPVPGSTPTPAGAVGSGTAPTVRVATPQGGGAGSGVSAGARVPVSPGGALGSGTSPASTTSVSQGAAAGSGVGPTARVSLSIGGATGGGVSPGEDIAADENVSPGGATAGGVSPSPHVSTTAGAGAASGVGPTAKASISAGGAAASGTGPGEPYGDNASPGGATAGGFAPAVLAFVPMGGGLGLGVAPGVAVSLLPGGAIAGAPIPTSPPSDPWTYTTSRPGWSYGPYPGSSYNGGLL